MSTLYLQILQNALCLAQNEPGKNAKFDFARQELSPDTPLAQALRELRQSHPLAQGEGLHPQVLVSGPAIPIPVSEFTEEESLVLYDSVVQTDTPHRVFYDPLPVANAMLLFSVA